MKVKYAILYVLMLFLMVGCTSSSTEKEALVSVTIEPQRYFVEKIGGADFTVNCVIPSGQSPETYDPTPKQMMRIGQSRAYLRIGYIGFEQAWMKNLEEQNPHMQVFDLSKGMNTGVCPPACINHHRMMVNALHGLHHDRFNTYGIFLTLPSGIMTAVIAENHFYTHPIAPIAIIMTSRRSPPNNRAKSQLCIFNFL